MTTPVSAVSALLLLATACVAQAVEAHALLAAQGGTFSYTVFNDEPAGSRLSVNTFHLELHSPVGEITSPPGWQFISDKATYVDWFCTNSTSANPTDIGPGRSLQGFTVLCPAVETQLLKYALASWNHALTNAGSVKIGEIQSPAISDLRPAFTNVSFSIGKPVQFTVVGVPGLSYAVSTSLDFLNWSPIFTNTSPFTFSTNNPAPPRLFYRSFLVPTDSASSFLVD